MQKDLVTFFFPALDLVRDGGAWGIVHGKGREIDAIVMDLGGFVFEGEQALDFAFDTFGGKEDGVGGLDGEQAETASDVEIEVVLSQLPRFFFVSLTEIR